MVAAGWDIVRESRPKHLAARTTGTLIGLGERVDVLCRDQEVRVACICDPSVGYSLTGSRRCEDHRRLVIAAISTATRAGMLAAGGDAPKPSR